MNSRTTHGIIISLIVIFSIIISIGLFSGCADDNQNSSEATAISQESPFVANAIQNLEIISRGNNKFDFSVKSDIGTAAKLYFTTIDKFDIDKASIVNCSYSQTDSEYQFSLDGEIMQNLTKNSKTVFLWAIEGDKQAVLPITFPSIDPFIEINDKGYAVISFELDTATSWSSYCDPAGKSVYRSASYTWDDNSELVSEGINIITVSYTDRKYDPSKPFYYIVLTSKNGIVKFVSPAIIRTDVAFSDIAVSIPTDSKTPTLHIEATKSIDAGEYSLIICTDKETYTVAKTSADGTKIVFDFDITKLKKRGIWYDILLADTLGHEYEIESSSNKGGILIKDDIKYYLPEWEGIVKICADIYETGNYNLTSVDISVIDGKPILNITGKLINAEFVKLKINDSLINSTVNDSVFTISYDLTQLSEISKWYDIHLYYNDTDYDDILITELTVDMNKTVEANKKLYKFQSWENCLKVCFTEPDFEISDVSLKNEKLVITGKKSDSLDINLKVDSKDGVADNKAAQFTLSYNLSKLTEAEKWYDIHLYYSVSGSNEILRTDIDVSKISVNMTQTFKTEARTYAFSSYENCLKVLFTENKIDTDDSSEPSYEQSEEPSEDSSEEPLPEKGYCVEKIEFKSEAGKAYLIASGKFSGSALTAKVGDDSAEVLCSGSNFTLKYDLSKLSEIDKRYEMKITQMGSSEEAVKTSDSNINIKQTLSVSERKYSFVHFETVQVFYRPDPTGTEYNPEAIEDLMQYFSFRYDWRTDDNGNEHSNNGWYPVITCTGRIPNFISNAKVRISHDKAEIIKEITISDNRMATFEFDLTELLQFKATKTDEWFWIEVVCDYEGTTYQLPVPVIVYKQDFTPSSEYGWLEYLGEYTDADGDKQNFNFRYTTLENFGQCLLVSFGK